MNILIAVIVVATIIIIYFTTYILNSKIKPPVDITLEKCSGCHIVECTHHPTKEELNIQTSECLIEEHDNYKIN